MLKLKYLLYVFNHGVRTYVLGSDFQKRSNLSRPELSCS